MPKQTFFNLPEAKRQAILDIAIEEFAESDFKTASVSRIVAKAGIAKGSLYQYFEDKEDLYLYLLRLAGEEKMKFLQGSPPPTPQMGLFAYLRWLMEIGVRFRFAHPKLDQMVYRAFYQDGSLQSEAVEQMNQQAKAYWLQQIQMGMERGDIDPSYDPDVVAWMFTVMSTEVGRYVLTRLGGPADSYDNLADRYIAQSAPMFAEMLKALEYGLRPR